MRVLAIVVTYNPDIALLTEALRSVAPEVQGIVVVDNGSSNAVEVSTISSKVGAHLLFNSENLGIAAAQNQGIELARENHFSHILLLDQDTILFQGAISNLLKNLEDLERDQGKIAAVGPAYMERHSQRRNRAYRSTGPRLQRIALEEETRPIASDFIIASASLIPIEVLNTIGNFKEELFIDLVDVEWCLRARSAGYNSFLIPTVIVDHHLGSGTLGLKQHRITVHAPIRDYYWVRNAMWLARQPYTPLAWRLYFLRRSLAFFATYPILADKGGLRLKLIGQGIWDSLGGRLGRLRQ
jgi:rhamnosyltransferase